MQGFCTPMVYHFEVLRIRLPVENHLGETRHEVCTWARSICSVCRVPRSVSSDRIYRVLEEEEPLAGDAAIVEHVLALKIDHEPLAVVIRPGTHVFHEAVLEDPPAVHAHVALGVGNQAHR